MRNKIYEVTWFVEVKRKVIAKSAVDALAETDQTKPECDNDIYSVGPAHADLKGYVE